MPLPPKATPLIGTDFTCRDSKILINCPSLFMPLLHSRKHHLKRRGGLSTVFTIVCCKSYTKCTKLVPFLY